MRQRTELGRILAKKRVDLDVKQGQMAKELGCSNAFLSSVERGVNVIPVTMAEYLYHRYFEISPEAELFLEAFGEEYFKPNKTEFLRKVFEMMNKGVYK